jgi:hypothetical protein
MAVLLGRKDDEPRGIEDQAAVIIASAAFFRNLDGVVRQHGR